MSCMRLAPALTAALFAAVFALSFFVPVYNDEISVPLVTARGGWDGWALLHMRPACAGAYGAPVPLLLLPGRAAAWGLHVLAGTPAGIRVMGMVTALLWLAAATAGLYHATGRRLAWTGWLGWLLCLGGLGVLPLMLVITRPEMPMALALLGYVLTPFLARGLRGRRLWLAAAGWLWGSSWFLGAHPKALVFLPVMGAGLWLAGRRQRAAAVVCALALAAMAAQAAALWSAQLHCPGYPPAQARMQALALLPEAVRADPLAAAGRFLGGIASSPRYVRSLLFAPEYASAWLPERAPGAAYGALNLYIAAVAAALLLATPLAALRRGGRSLRRAEAAMPLLLWGCLLALAGLQSEKNFYDALLLLPCAMVCAGLCLADALPRLEGLRRALCLGSAASLAGVLLLFHDLPQRSLAAGDHGQLPRQWKSSAVTGFAARRAHILRVAAQCGLAPGMAHMVVDQFTYPVFREGYRPLYEIRSGLGSVQAMGASGVVTSCLPLPPALRAVAVEEGGLCCVGRDALMRVQDPK